MLKIVGDVNFTDSDFNVGFGIGSQLGPKFDPLSRVITNNEDCWIGNFEGVASDSSENKGIYSKKFRVSPSKVLQVKHCNVYGVANNHIMQHGSRSFSDTVNTIVSTGADYFGSKEKKTAVFFHQGRQVSITGLSYRIEEFHFSPCYWHNPELDEIADEYKKIPPDAFKIVYLHWGNEFVEKPSSYQKKIARWLVNLGFDLIIGMHPHVLQGYECYHSKYIFYSIGNCVFDMAYEPTHFGSIINVDFKDGNESVSFEYIKINKHFKPEIISEEVVPSNYRFEYLNKFLIEEYNSEVYNTYVLKAYKKYRNANRSKILKDFIYHPQYSMPILMDFIKRKMRIK